MRFMWGESVARRAKVSVIYPMSKRKGGGLVYVSGGRRAMGEGKWGSCARSEKVAVKGGLEREDWKVAERCAKGVKRCVNRWGAEGVEDDTKTGGERVR